MPPLLLSKSRPARIATACGPRAHLLAPPSIPKQGCGPAPRQFCPGPPTFWAWACTVNMEQAAEIQTAHLCMMTSLLPANRHHEAALKKSPKERDLPRQFQDVMA